MVAQRFPALTQKQMFKNFMLKEMSEIGGKSHGSMKHIRSPL